LRKKTKKSAVVCQVDGVISEIRDEGKKRSLSFCLTSQKSQKLLQKRNHRYRIHCKLQAYGIGKSGARVKRGDIITDGSADIDEIFKFAGKEKAENYIIAEVNKILRASGRDGVSKTHRGHCPPDVRAKKDRRGWRFFLLAGRCCGTFHYLSENIQLKEKGKESKSYGRGHGYLRSFSFPKKLPFSRFFPAYDSRPHQ